MSRRGNCHDNAVMEAFFSSLKSELADRFGSCGDAKVALCDYVEVFDNQRRRHSTLDYLSPAEFERRAPVNRSSLLASSNERTSDDRPNQPVH
jgi:putative transposase